MTDTRLLHRADGSAYEVKATGGTWDPDRRGIYFFAMTDTKQRTCACDHNRGCTFQLLAMNDLASANAEGQMADAINLGYNALIDSGIFWMTNAHKRVHHITMDEALKLPPEDIDGFDELRALYSRICGTYGARSWGYIEMDQGGAVHKRRIRAEIEAEGLAPIPVWHPLVDGLDYFTELAESYDRICMGNVVQANRDVRRRLLSVLFEQHRRYPELYVHILGFTPNELLASYPWDSCDSTSWLNAVRWGNMQSRALGKPIALMGHGYLCNIGDSQGLYLKSVAHAATEIGGQVMSLGTFRRELHDLLEVPMYPAPHEEVA